MIQKLTPQTVHLLKRVSEIIQKEPQTYDQGHFGTVCKTAYCVAGHLCMIADGYIPTMGVASRAQEILGMQTAYQAHCLFTIPSVNMCKYQNPDDASRAAAGALHIENFIKSNT